MKASPCDAPPRLVDFAAPIVPGVANGACSAYVQRVAIGRQPIELLNVAALGV